MLWRNHKSWLEAGLILCILVSYSHTTGTKWLILYPTRLSLCRGILFLFLPWMHAVIRRGVMKGRIVRKYIMLMNRKYDSPFCLSKYILQRSQMGVVIIANTRIGMWIVCCTRSCCLTTSVCVCVSVSCSSPKMATAKKVCIVGSGNW